MSASHWLTLELWLAKDNRFLNPKSSYGRILTAPPCRLTIQPEIEWKTNWLKHFHKHNFRHLPRFPDFFVTFRILSPSFRISWTYLFLSQSNIWRRDKLESKWKRKSLVTAGKTWLLDLESSVDPLPISCEILFSFLFSF